MEQLKQHLKDRNTDDPALELCKKIVDEKQSNGTENTDVSDNKNRTKLLQFRVSEEEFEKINKRFEKSYSKSLSEYLRTSALSCVNMVVDEELFKGCTRKISGRRASAGSPRFYKCAENLVPRAFSENQEQVRAIRCAD